MAREAALINSYRRMLAKVGEHEASDGISVDQLHAIWASMEKYLQSLDIQLQRLSLSHPDVAKSYGLYRANCGEKYKREETRNDIV